MNNTPSKTDNMNQLVLNINNQAITNSLLVAEHFGKNHKDVIRAIRTLIADIQASRNFALCPSSMFKETTYTAVEDGREYPMFLMNRDGFSLLVMGFTGKRALKFKLDFINAFNTMEDELRRIAATGQGQQPKRLADVISEGRRLSEEMRMELADGKHLPIADVTLTAGDVAIYSYLRNGLANATDTPFLITSIMISKALGIDLREVDAAWEKLERGGYIIRRQFGDCYSFILGSRIP